MNFQIRVTGFRNGRGQFASLASALPGGAREMHERIAPDIKQKFELKSPRATGNLAENWTYNVTGDGNGSTLTFSNNVGYLDAVIKGRRPGIIEAKQGGVLAFQIGGKQIFTKSVYHPGTAPNDFTQGIDEDYFRIAEPAMTAIMNILITRHLTDG
jgi:hypothetical protein